MREEADFLNDISDAAAQLRDLLGGRVVATNAHGTSSGGEEAIDQPECRALSRPAAAEEDERLAGPYGKRYVVDERSALQLVPQAAHVENLGHLAGMARVLPQRFRGGIDTHDIGARGFGLAT